MTASRLVLPLLAALVLAGCDTIRDDPPPTTPTPITLTASETALVGQSNAFGVDLFAQVAAKDDGNLMLSPLSASTSLTMLLNGTDGETYTQIRDMLGYGPAGDLGAINAGYRSLRDQLLAADPEVQFTLANAAFYDRAYASAFPFKSSFLDAVRDGFDATVTDLPFADPASVDVINRWASDHTAGRVPKVLDELDPDLVLLLMNALYFKGEWSSAFEESATAPAPFRLADGRTIQVPTMSGKVPALAARGDGYTALELPYGRRNFSLVVLVPDAAPLAAFAADLAEGGWADATARLDAAGEWGGVEVRLPRFSFETSKVLNAPLQALGMRDAFTSAADLSRMSDDPRLFVSVVKQDAFVQVNEEGTEAAAVTTTGVSVTSAGPMVSVDRPFVFGIRERTTNTLLFIGQVANPAS